MPDITAARPVAGESIATDWGQQIHDAVESAGVLGRQTFTAAVTISATTEAAANTIVTAPAVVLGSAQSVDIEVDIPYISMPNDVANRSLNLWIYENGTSVGRLCSLQNPTAGSMSIPVFARLRRSLSAGTYTYSVRGSVSGSSGSANAGAGGAGNVQPGSITVRGA